MEQVAVSVCMSAYRSSLVETHNLFKYAKISWLFSQEYRG
jgi:hypothetical protein